MYLAKTKEPLSSTIPTITTTHTLPFIHTLLPSIFYPTLTTKKHEMDLLPKDVTPPILQVLENNTLFKKPHPSVPPLFYHETQIYQIPLKAEILAQHFEQSHHLTLNMGSNTHSLTVIRHVNKFFRSTPSQTPLLKLTNHQDVRRRILALKPCAAPGDDGITSTMLRHLSQKSLILFNSTL